MANPDRETQSAYIEAQGGDPDKDFIDPEIVKTRTPEGLDMMKRVLGSTPLRIQIFDTNSLRRHRRKSGE